MNHRSQLSLCSAESRAWSKGYVPRMPLECQPSDWGAGEGVGWGRKEIGVSTGPYVGPLVCVCFSEKIFTFQCEQESPGAGQQGPEVGCCLLCRVKLLESKFPATVAAKSGKLAPHLEPGRVGTI